MSRREKTYTATAEGIKDIRAVATRLRIEEGRVPSLGLAILKETVALARPGDRLAVVDPAGALVGSCLVIPPALTPEEAEHAETLAQLDDDHEREMETIQREHKERMAALDAKHQVFMQRSQQMMAPLLVVFAVMWFVIVPADQLFVRCWVAVLAAVAVYSMLPKRDFRAWRLRAWRGLRARLQRWRGLPG